jgi:hypothetical protein
MRLKVFELQHETTLDPMRKPAREERTGEGGRVGGTEGRDQVEQVLSTYPVVLGAPGRGFLGGGSGGHADGRARPNCVCVCRSSIA